jgi:dipeptidyl aminopeptidase/acylaminoacyl peptidase
MKRMKMLKKSRIVVVAIITITTLLTLVSLPVLVPNASAVPRVAPLSVEAIAGMRTLCPLQQPALSGDGEWLAYVLQDPRHVQLPTDDRYAVLTASGVHTLFLGCDVWVTNLRTGESHIITGGVGTNTRPAWSPDGRLLAFFSDRGGEAKIWLWERSSGRLRPASNASVLIMFGSLVWTPDGKRIAVTTTLPQGMSVEDAIDVVGSGGTAYDTHGKNKAPLVYTAHAGVPKDKGADTALADATLPGLTLDIALIEIATGNVERPVRGVDTNAICLSPEGDSFAFLDFKRLDKSAYVFDLARVDLPSGRSQVLVRGIKAQWSLTWSPDSRSIVYATSGSDGEFFLVPAAGGLPRPLTNAAKVEIDTGQPPLWDQSGTTLYVQSKSRNKDILWRVRIADGAMEPIVQLSDYSLEGIVHRSSLVDVLPQIGWIYTLASDRHTHREGIYRVDLRTHQFSHVLGDENQLISGALFSPDGSRLIWRQQDAVRPPDLWTADADFQHPKRLTHSNPELENSVFGETRLIDWRTEEGKELHGGLILPVGYQEGQRYPLIVCVYGGDGLSEAVHAFSGSAGCDFNLQLLATRGYAVLYADSITRRGTPISDLAKSVLPGIDRAIELGFADPERIGVMGHSYGAYSTLALIVQSARFKAAVSVGGMSDLLSTYGQMEGDGTPRGVLWAEEDQGNLGGSPWEYRDRYIENSPFFYFDRVQAPVLLIHGAADFTVAPWLGDQTFVGLRRLGKEVTYVKYRNGGHSSSEWNYADRVDYYNRVIAWFDKYLKDRPVETGLRP